MRDVQHRIESFLQQQEGLEVVAVNLGGRSGKPLIQVLVDKEGGVGLEDLSSINSQLSNALDQWDIVPDSYFLEVSSAGLERPLNKLEHYQRFCGKKAKVVLKHPLPSGRKRITGVIQSVAGDIITFNTDAEVLTVDFDQIKKANLVFEM